jgi:hypothetical protein
MNLEPAPSVPGVTDPERMSNALRMVLTVPKQATLKAEAKLNRAKEKKRKKRTGRRFTELHDQTSLPVRCIVFRAKTEQHTDVCGLPILNRTS